MPMATLYAELLDAHVRPWEVKHLTNQQIEDIVRHERDKAGRLVTHEAPPLDPRETFFAVWKHRGLPEWRIELKWQEHQRRKAEKGERRGL